METALGPADGRGRAGDRASQAAVAAIGRAARCDRRCAKLAEAAVARGDDEAARRELRRKAEHQRLADALSATGRNADALGQRLRHQVTAMRIKLAEAGASWSTSRPATGRGGAAKVRRALAGRSVHRHGVVELRNDVRRVEQSEAETEALLELLGEPESTEPFDTEVEAELRALKETASHVTS